MTIDDFLEWASSKGLEIVLIAIGAVLVARAIRWAADRYSLRIETLISQEASAKLATPEETKHKRVLVQGLTWLMIAVVYFVAGIMIFQKFNFPLSGIVAPATVVGAAVGFGSQRLVQDLVGGFLIFSERQYGYGDVVKVSQPGTEEGISGTVEEVTLRATTLRTVSGELVILPNGEIRQVTNMSKDWAQVVIDIPLPADVDLTRANELLHQVSEEFAADEDWSWRLLLAPSVMGIEKLAVGFLQLRFVARTLPDEQWNVARELRGRIAVAFKTNGIVIQPSFAAGIGGV